ncbi:MAG: hypothetical protein JO337_05315 [Acidimicrobiales bacterium]|nr:hypothetical protein [Acidimicrobiales bacterium]
MSAKLVVTPRKGGSHISLVGKTGKELLGSVVFTEPRAKGATVRALKGLLGDDVVIEDHTSTSPARTSPKTATAATASRARKTTRKAATRTTRQTARRTTNPVKSRAKR